MIPVRDMDIWDRFISVTESKIQPKSNCLTAYDAEMYYDLKGCPFCGSEEFKHNGKNKKHTLYMINPNDCKPVLVNISLQRYKCNACRHYFSASHGLIGKETFSEDFLQYLLEEWINDINATFSSLAAKYDLKSRTVIQDYFDLIMSKLANSLVGISQVPEWLVITRFSYGDKTGACVMGYNPETDDFTLIGFVDNYTDKGVSNFIKDRIQNPQDVKVVYYDLLNGDPMPAFKAIRGPVFCASDRDSVPGFLDEALVMDRAIARNAVNNTQYGICTGLNTALRLRGSVSGTSSVVNEYFKMLRTDLSAWEGQIDNDMETTRAFASSVKSNWFNLSNSILLEVRYTNEVNAVTGFKKSFYSRLSACRNHGLTHEKAVYRVGKQIQTGSIFSNAFMYPGMERIEPSEPFAYDYVPFTMKNLNLLRLETMFDTPEFKKQYAKYHRFCMESPRDKDNPAWAKMMQERKISFTVSSETFFEALQNCDKKYHYLHSMLL